VLQKKEKQDAVDGVDSNVKNVVAENLVAVEVIVLIQSQAQVGHWPVFQEAVSDGVGQGTEREIGDPDGLVGDDVMQIIEGKGAVQGIAVKNKGDDGQQNNRKNCVVKPLYHGIWNIVMQVLMVQ
jgi:hypothetical protein